MSGDAVTPLPDRCKACADAGLDESVLAVAADAATRVEAGVAADAGEALARAVVRTTPNASIPAAAARALNLTIDVPALLVSCSFFLSSFLPS
jgi:hypothetical protein